MSSDLPQEEQPSKTWWSLSKSPSSKDLRQAYAQGKHSLPNQKSSGKLNSLATAIGLKPKKQQFPTLTIQEPPPPSVITDLPRPDSNYNTLKKLPSKLTRSRTNSAAPQPQIEPIHEKRHSLLTLSDDPFAGRSPIQHLPPGPSRMSSYSSQPGTSTVQERSELPPQFHRTSYASSSSNYGIDSSTASSTNSPPPEHQLQTKRSIQSLQAKMDGMYRQASLTPTSYSRPEKLPMQTPTQRNSQIDNSTTLRPKMRARGMTDSGAMYRPAVPADPPSAPRTLSHKSSYNFHVQDSDTYAYDEPSSSKSPRVIIHQPSVPRIHPAPTSPPTNRLPPPPFPMSSQTRLEDLSASRASASSSSTSFTSSDSLMGALTLSSNYDKAARKKRESDRESILSSAQGADANLSSRRLKKESSHTSLKHTRIPPESPSSNPQDHVDLGTDSAKHKSRRFPPRLPIPPVPMTIRPSTSPGPTSFPSASDQGSTNLSDKRVSSSSTGRRRLFSSSSRPSTSPRSPISLEEETQSILSLRSDVDAHLSHFKPWLTTPTSSSSSAFRDEERSVHIPTSPIFPPPDFSPKSIMSAAEIEKLEATVDNYMDKPSIRSRSRGFSMLSSSTAYSDYSVAPDIDNNAPTSLSPRPIGMQTSIHESPMRQRRRSRQASPTPSGRAIEGSIDEDSEFESHRSPVVRTAIVRTPPPLPSIGTGGGLPPPPRRGRKGTLVSHVDPDEMQPVRTAHQRPSSIKSNIKNRGDKSHARKPLMRKPSFLDIEDEPEPKPVMKSGDGSFLDLARESFDTAR